MYLCQRECTTKYSGDSSMPVSFDPSRINPHVIKNSLADRRLVLSGGKAICISIVAVSVWQQKDILKGND